MNRPNELMTMKGFDLQGRKRDLTLEQPFSNTDDKHYGMPITPCAALEMIRRFKEQMEQNPHDLFANVYWVEFSKASIFRMLSYENCEYIRFYLAIPEVDGKDASLSLECINASKEVIGEKALLEIAGKMESHIVSQSQEPFNEDSVYKEFNNELPPKEEKGNGGKGFLETTNVKSMRDFFDKKSEELSQGTFVEFLTAFYKHAEEKF
ncbi:hypothetical protein DBR43_31115 [Pedobacter sp. KBW06]|uniref:hypothetical protein n=1 Tax=Pedobacter sp. KBW06 TaxID=2153359 RepID=UPI000F5B60FA|nr:hypothetical protein [Pedobacter sp. KBW06]RQO65297.1 hypothetical protein DBR43_31115 [Pedobacter sp. KBW06]